MGIIRGPLSWLIVNLIRIAEIWFNWTLTLSPRSLLLPSPTFPHPNVNRLNTSSIRIRRYNSTLETIKRERERRKEKEREKSSSNSGSKWHEGNRRSLVAADRGSTSHFLYRLYPHDSISLSPSLSFVVLAPREQLRSVTVLLIIFNFDVKCVFFFSSLLIFRSVSYYSPLLFIIIMIIVCFLLPFSFRRYPL